MSEDSLGAEDNPQKPGNSDSKGIAKVLLTTTVVGTLSGVTLLGLTEWIPALVLPHGGPEHIHWDHPLLGAFALVGGAAGLALGSLIAFLRRKI